MTQKKKGYIAIIFCSFSENVVIAFCRRIPQLENEKILIQRWKLHDTSAITWYNLYIYLYYSEVCIAFLFNDSVNSAQILVHYFNKKTPEFILSNCTICVNEIPVAVQGGYLLFVMIIIHHKCT